MNANTVRQDRFINLLSEHAPVLSRWSFQANEPYSVTVAFQAGPDKWVEWIFARDLLLAGLHGPAGIGDVRFVPFEDLEERLLMLQVESDQGRASWFLDRSEAEEFAEMIRQIVPEGAEEEYFDVDAFLDEITDV
ncbi:MAG: SsgA family sporulation/cell division regulator [Actinophytocola sp.]|nr:SsgA family sporulation/cell division regulator [Actinophytocola sp.]